MKFATEKTTETNSPLQARRAACTPWAIPGTKGLEHRIGGLEKQHETGNISYDAANHEFMVRMREAKVEKIADYIPEIKPEIGNAKGKALDARLGLHLRRHQERGAPGA